MKLPNVGWGGMVRVCLGAVLAAVLAGCGEPGAKAGADRGGTSRQVFQVKGVVTEIKMADGQAVIRHEEIPNYMAAMTMPFVVRNTNELAGLAPGDEVAFAMVVTADDGWIENLRKTGVSTNLPPAQRQPIRLVRDVEPIEPGDKMPNYPFTNALGKRIELGDFAGQAYAFTFIFTRCPFPTFCPRMSSNFEDAYKTLAGNAAGPTNWHLFSISFDPDFDTPERLKAYSATYQPDPKHWDWVTGAMIDIDAITEQVGLVFTAETNTFNHNLRTVVVDRSGIVKEILIGNEWTGEQLAGLIATAATATPPAEAAKP